MSAALSVYLDVLRLSAALIVFAHHASNPRFDGGWISALRGYGHEAVIVFFVLSGFVMSFVTDTKEGTARQYFAGRVSRLWSVALPAVLATLLMDSAGRVLASAVYADVQAPPFGALASSLFVNEFWLARRHVGSNVPYWSLSYEAAYYILFGLFLFSRIRWLWVCVAAAMIGPKILLLLPAWVAGAVAYREAQRSRSRMANSLLAVCGAVLALGLTLTKLGNIYIEWRWRQWGGEEIYDAMGFSTTFLSDNLIALGLGAHLVGMAGILGRISISAHARAIISTAALATFPIYLFHYPALYFFTAVSLYAFSAKVGVLIGLASLGLGVVVTPMTETLRLRLRTLMLGSFVSTRRVRTR